jgi:pantothenate kinase
MSTGSLKTDVEQICGLIKSNMQGSTRTIIGIAGPPASGKSTLAEAVVQHLNKEMESSLAMASLLPMDGYHLDNRLLESRGLLSRKGSPETFNADGFCEAVTRISVASRETFHPIFDRQLDLAIANAISISPDTPVVVVEGNYILLKTDPWSSLSEVFDTTVFVCPGLDILRDRLQQRWIDHGLDPEAAMLRATGNDLVNAELILRDSVEADITLTQNHIEFGVCYTS